MATGTPPRGGRRGAPNALSKQQGNANERSEERITCSWEFCAEFGDVVSAIHLAVNDRDVIAHVPEFHTTINNKEGSARCHRNMYGKLMKLLRATGKA